MKPQHTFLTALVAIAALGASQPDAPRIDAYFSPRGGAAAAIAQRIDAATTSIDVAAYELSYRPLVDALIRARIRGVTIRVIVDRRVQAELNTEPIRLRQGGIAVGADGKENIHHNKYCVIDATITITGSQNWTNNGEERNAENTIIVYDPNTATRYATDFARHWLHCTPFTPTADPRRSPRTQPRKVPFPR